MIESIPRETIVEMLLNTLEAERYVRGPLLHNVVDELTATARFAPAAALATKLLADLEDGRVSDGEFTRSIVEIRTCVRRLSYAGLESPTDAIARAVQRTHRGVGPSMPEDLGPTVGRTRASAA